MDRLRKALRLSPSPSEQPYEPLAGSETLPPRESPLSTSSEPHHSPSTLSRPFSSTEYTIFLLLGISMLWAWNMFLAAGPYFQFLFRHSAFLSSNFQAAEISVSTITNFASMLVLTRLQSHANYPKRIITSLLINMVVFALLAASTTLTLGAQTYFGFLMVMIFLTSLAAGLCQNGIFAYVSGFGQMKYTQGIMTGQAVAGVLPCIAQIVAIMAVNGGGRREQGGEWEEEAPVHWTSALGYFATATGISAVTLVAFLYLVRREQRRADRGVAGVEEEEETGGQEVERKSVPLLRLGWKLRWLAAGVFLTFAITMVFPVFTQQILSNRPLEEQGRLFQPPSFIPLAFLFWNSGDLLGRMITAVPSLSLIARPRVVFTLAVCRLVFIGLYNLCNIRGSGAVVPSDFFYLVVVQLGFGLTNGYLGSTCMIAAGDHVEPEEREAAGGFMSLCLVGGLTVGSLASFFVANV